MLTQHLVVPRFTVKAFNSIQWLISMVTYRLHLMRAQPVVSLQSPVCENEMVRKSCVHVQINIPIPNKEENSPRGGPRSVHLM